MIEKCILDLDSEMSIKIVYNNFYYRKVENYPVVFKIVSILSFDFEISIEMSIFTRLYKITLQKVFSG